jgi:hypothetical protein
MSNFDPQGTRLSGKLTSYDSLPVFECSVLMVMFDGLTLVVYELTSVVYDINNNTDVIILPTECDKVTSRNNFWRTSCSNIRKRALSTLSCARVHA